MLEKESKNRRASLILGVPAFLIVGLMLTAGLTSAAIVPMYVPPEGFCGYVYDQYTGDPIVGATVSGAGTSYTTGNNGYYQIYTGRGGTYTFSVTKTGFNQWSGTASAGGSTGWGSKNVYLNHTAGVYGRIRDAVSGQALSGVTIGFTALLPTTYYPSFSYSTTTDANGFYYISNYFTSYFYTWYEVISPSDHWTQIHLIGHPPSGSYIRADNYIQPNTLSDMTVCALYVHPQGMWSDVTWGETLTYSNTYTHTVTMQGSMMLGIGSTKSFSVSTTSSYPNSDSLTGYRIYERIWISGVSQYNPATGKNDVVNCYAVNTAPYQQILTYNEADWQTSMPGGSQPTILPIPVGDSTQTITSSGTNIQDTHMDVSITLGAAYFSTTAFNLACSRSDSSNTVAEMSITFHSGSSHTMKIFWQDSGTGLIAHIWSMS